MNQDSWSGMRPPDEDGERPVMSSPPTESPTTGPQNDSTWARPVGICGIIYASFGLIGGCVGFGGYFATKYMPQMMTWANQQSSGAASGSGGGSGTAAGTGPASPFGAAQQAQLDVAAQYAWITLVLALAFFSVAIWLLVSSIGLTRQKPWSAKHTVMASVVRLVLGAMQVGATVFVSLESPDAMRATPNYDSSMDLPVIAGMLFGAVFSVVWSLLYPGFALVWFSRGKIRREVQAWGGGEPSGEVWSGASYGDR